MAGIISVRWVQALALAAFPVVMALTAFAGSTVLQSEMMGCVAAHFFAVASALAIEERCRPSANGRDYTPLVLVLAGCAWTSIALGILDSSGFIGVIAAMAVGTGFFAVGNCARSRPRVVRYMFIVGVVTGVASTVDIFGARWIQGLVWLGAACACGVARPIHEATTEPGTGQERSGPDGGC